MNKASSYKKYQQNTEDYFHQPNDSKIQFFSSGSSVFSSFNDSELQFTQNSILQQVNIIFQTLKKQLQSTQHKNNQSIMQNIINRANILCKFTIPQSIQYLQKIKTQVSPKIYQSFKKCKQLAQNYQKMTENSISYQQFYNLYKKIDKARVSKNYQQKQIQLKDLSNIVFQFTEKIQIIHKQANNQYEFNTKASPFKRSAHILQSSANKKNGQSLTDEIYELKVENKNLIENVYTLKKEIQSIKNQTRKILQRERSNFYERIQKIINIKLSELQKSQISYSQFNFNHKSNMDSKINNGNLSKQKPRSEASFVTLMKQLQQINKNLKYQIEQNSKNIQKIIQLQDQLNRFNLENINLKQDIKKSQKIATSHYLNLNDQNLMSINKQQLLSITKLNQTNNQIDYKSIIKRNQFLTIELRLLKRQLLNQRQASYKAKQSVYHQNYLELVRVKDQVQNKNSEILALQIQLDQFKTKSYIREDELKNAKQKQRKYKLKNQYYEENIQELKASQFRNTEQSSNFASNYRFSQEPSNHAFSKTGESFYRSQNYSKQLNHKSINVNSALKSKQLIQQLKTQQKLLQKRQQKRQQKPLQKRQQQKRQQKQKQKLQSPKLKIQPYLSDVLQGFVYYQCLQKQHRYRYRRACIKSKQLLYKKDGFEVGVVSKSMNDLPNPNLIAFTLFITNSAQLTLNNLKLSVMNSNNSNIIKLSNPNAKYSLKPGDQAKATISIQINNYPIGSFVLLIEGVNSQIRLLIPASIIKLFKFEEISLNRNQIIQNEYQKLTVQAEIKVYKSFQNLIQCFTGNKKQNHSNNVSLKAYHEHTKTTVNMLIEYVQKTQEINVYYFKQAGNLNIVDTLMKNMKLLLQKQRK